MTEESPRRPRLDLGPKRRWSAGRGPERPANRVGGWLGGLALRTRLGMGSRSSLERRTEGDRGGGGMRRRRRTDSRSGAGMTEESPRRPRLDLGPKRRWSAGRGPERPAHKVGGWLGGLALRTTLGMGSRSSLERRTGGVGRFPLGAGMTEERPRRPRLDLGPKRRWSAGRGPERPANRVGGWLGGLALRTTLGMGSRSSLERRTGGDRGGGGMRRPPPHRFPLGAGMTEERPRRPRLDLGPKRRWSAGRGPERPANRVGGWLGGLALRTTLGMGSRSSLERRTGGDRGGGGMRRPPPHRFPLGGGNDGGEPPSPQT